MATCLYKVGYIAKDGTEQVFGFKSDRKMISNRKKSLSGTAFCYTWRSDMNKAIVTFMHRDTAMKRCGGIDRFRYVMNVTTGQVVETEYII